MYFSMYKRAVAKVGNRFRRSAVVSVLEAAHVLRHTDALAAAAGRCLEHHRITDALRLGQRLVKVTQRAVRTQSDRYARRNRVTLGLGLVAHQSDGRSSRPNEGQTGLRRALGKVRVLGQETKARVDRLTARRERRRDDVIHIQIAVRRAGRTDAHRFVRDLRMQRFAVGLGIHGNRYHTQIAARLNDADRDFTAVRNEYLLKHVFPRLSP